MAKRGVSRRSVVKFSLAAGVWGATGAKIAKAEPQWKKFSGTTLEVNLLKGSRADILQRYEKEFTELTGIKVSSEQIPEQQQRQKVVIELSSGKPSFDVVHLSYHVQKRQFDKAGWLADFSSYIKDPNLTSADLVESDFTDSGLTYAKNAKGELRSLPFSADYFIMYWNKELFAKKGIKYPQTFDELVSAADALTDPKTGTYGFVARGLRNANIQVWSSFMLGYGGEFVDANGNILSDSAESIAGAKLYQRIMTKAAPPGIAGFNWAECQSTFLQGKAAMWPDGVGFAPAGEDPEKSKVVGKIGYGVFPRGPKAHHAISSGDGIGVAQASTKKEAGYLYCQWAVSKVMGARLLQSGGGVPFRNSILADPNVRKDLKLPAEWVEAVAESAKIAKSGFPPVMPVTEYRDIIGTALTATLSGADPAAELKKATEQFKPILERSEKA
jgi:multiple sugar transport system substrate-binding protein